ncbi:amidase family protein [Arthrobacter sp. NPDC080073]|uniref:amidase family protein n=1 Tax=Arthrobacter sp. NPDC080073 TaxID=3155919 RepID=UPI0034143C6A
MQNSLANYLENLVDVSGLVVFATELAEALEQLPASPPLPLSTTLHRRQLPRKKIDDPLNAIVREIDVRSEASGPLEGLRVTLKDSIAVGGIEMTCGSAALQGFVPAGDATVTRRLLDAGSSLVAVTNMDDLALSGGGDTSFYGPTRNPFDAHRSAGGSSGGAAASLRYEDVDVAIGTDQGGSVRLPAAWCGVIGLKPTHGLVPYTGVVGMDSSLDHVGIMAKNVGVVADVLEVIAGADPLDPRQRNLPSPDRDSYSIQSVRGIGDNRWRVRVLKAAVDRSDHAVRSAFETVMTKWRVKGIEVDDCSLDDASFGPLSTGIFVEGMIATLAGIQPTFAQDAYHWTELNDALSQGVADNFDKLSPSVITALIAGNDLQSRRPGRSYSQAANAIHSLRTAYDGALRDVDFLVAPTSPSLPHVLDASVDDVSRTRRGWDVLANTGAVNLTGHPALSLPAGVSDGLPVGVMIVAPKWSEGRLLQFASQLEDSFIR